MPQDTRLLPLYTPTEVGLYTGLHSSTVRRWALGTKERSAILKKRSTQESGLTFLDFVELDFIGILRRQGLSLKEIECLYHEFSLKSTCSHNPLSYQYELHRFGKSLFLVNKDADSARDISSGQFGFKSIITEFSKHLDFDLSNQATRFYPDRDRAIVIDPDIRCGSPTLDGTRLDTAAVYELFKSENSNENVVAAWYDISVEKVKAAVDWEAKLRSKKAA